MRIVIYHPFQKVWTPRTPDSNYDSLGPSPATPIVSGAPIGAGLGLGVAFKSGQYVAQSVARSSSEGAGLGIRFLTGTYTA